MTEISNYIATTFHEMKTSFRQANAFCTRATGAFLLRTHTSSIDDRIRSFFYQAYVDMKIPSTVTPPVPSNKKSIPFTSLSGEVNVGRYNNIFVEADYGSVEMCAYFKGKNVHMFECDRYLYPLNTVICEYNWYGTLTNVRKCGPIATWAIFLTT